MQTRNPSRLLYIRKTTRGSNKQREKAIQKALMGTLRREFPLVIDFFNDWAAGAYLTHGQSAQRRVLSSGKGWSDLFIPYPVTHVLPGGVEKTYHGCFIEIKKENARIYRRDGGIVADEQIRIEEAF